MATTEFAGSRINRVVGVQGDLVSMPRKHSLEKRLAVVLAGLRAEDNIREICKEHGVEVKS